MEMVYGNHPRTESPRHFILFLEMGGGCRAASAYFIPLTVLFHYDAIYCIIFVPSLSRGLSCNIHRAMHKKVDLDGRKEFGARVSPTGSYVNYDRHY